MINQIDVKKEEALNLNILTNRVMRKTQTINNQQIFLIPQSR